MHDYYNYTPAAKPRTSCRKQRVEAATDNQGARYDGIHGFCNECKIRVLLTLKRCPKCGLHFRRRRKNNNKSDRIQQEIDSKRY